MDLVQDEESHQLSDFAPLNAPILTSNRESFLAQGSLLEKSTVFLACQIISLSWAEMGVCFLAKARASVSRVSEMEG